MASRSYWLGIFGVALLFVVLRWNNFAAPLTRDEGEYQYAAQLLLNGKLPYEHSFLQKPPMIAYTYAAADLLLPGRFWAPRLLAALFGAGATSLLGWCVRRDLGPGLTLPASALMTPMILLPDLDQFIANTEMFQLLPVMGLLAVYLHGRDGRGKLAHWLAAGGLAALAFCYKYTALPLLLFVLMVWILEEGRRRGWRAAAVGGLSACLAAVLTTAAILAVFLTRDGGKKLWECTVVFNQAYAATSFFGLRGTGVYLLAFLRVWWVLFLAPWFLLLKPPARWWFWVGLFLMAWVTTAGATEGHYYIVVMPFWAVLAAAGLGELAGWITARTGRILPAWILPAVAVALVCITDVRWTVLTPAQFSQYRLGPYGTFVASPAVAAKVAALVPPSGLVYVAGSEPQILYYAHRFSPTRFDIAYPLTFPTSLAAAYQAEATDDLQKNPPAAIVLAQTDSSWQRGPETRPEFFNFLDRFLTEQYEPVGAWMTNQVSGQWEEHPTPQLASRCQLIVFRRKAR